jgi:hypothetical protein
MASVRVKQIKVVKSAMPGSAEMTDMFNSVLGDGAVPINVAYPKYQAIARHCERFLRLLDTLGASSALGKNPDIAAQLVSYASALRVQYGEVFCAPDISGESADLHSVDPEKVKLFLEVYGKVSESNFVKVLLVTCNNIVPHKKAVEVLENFSDKFLRGAGLTFAPLPDLPALNFKYLYNNQPRTSEEDQEYYRAVLHKLYTITHDLYEAFSMPDIDVDEFVESTRESLKEVRKQIPRCDEAFDRLIESVSLLKTNFSSYYKDSQSSGNKMVIIENFVLDVSKAQKTQNAKVSRQFRDIISKYKSMVQMSHSADPQLSAAFAEVNKQISLYEHQSQIADAEAEDEPASEETRHLASPAIPAAVADTSRDPMAEGLAATFHTPTTTAAKRRARKNNKPASAAGEDPAPAGGDPSPSGDAPAPAGEDPAPSGEDLALASAAGEDPAPAADFSSILGILMKKISDMPRGADPTDESADDQLQSNGSSAATQ